MMITSVASARTDVFVHGRNQGPADTTDYWKVGLSGDGVYAFTGNNTEGRYVYAYDATKSWSNLSSNTMPVCALTQAIYSAPGTDMAVLGHSAGTAVALYLMAAAQNGWAHSCSVAPATAKAWVTYIISLAGPTRGTEVADAIYGGTSGSWWQQTCAWMAGTIANLAFNQASDMTWALQTSYMNNWFSSLTAYGSFASIYQNGGTNNSGDDSTGLLWAQYCANVEGNQGSFLGVPKTPNGNDGFISQNSVNGCVRGSVKGTNCLPGGHVKYFAAVGHSSNRRNNTGSFAWNVWLNNPY